MTLSMTFFILYLFSSLALLLVQIWLFFIVHFAHPLVSHFVCRLGNFFAMGGQMYLAKTGRFPFGILTSQTPYIDDVVRLLAIVFMLLHPIVYIFVLHGGLPKPRRKWRD